MRWAGLCFTMVLVVGCGPRPQSCRTSADCPESSTCERYFCISNESTTETYDGGLHVVTDGDGGENDDGGALSADGGEQPGDVEDGGEDDVDAGPGAITCTSHAQCQAPLKCRGHVCR